MEEQYVIVRCSGAGVHAGFLASKSGDTVILHKARRLWRWWSKFTLSELAQQGPIPDKIAENRYSVPVDQIELREWCEIINCTPVAEQAIRGVPNANQ